MVDWIDVLGGLTDDTGTAMPSWATDQNFDGWIDVLGGMTDSTGTALPSWATAENLVAAPSWLKTALSVLGIGAGNEGGILGGISGKTAGLGAQGILGVLAALNEKPQLGTKQTSETQTGSTTTEVGSPEWYKQLTENLGTAISGDNKSWSDLQGYLTGGVQSVADADLSKYTNPYTSAVLQPQIDRMTEDFLRDQNSRQAKASMVGAFGGSRATLEDSLAGERFDKGVNELTNNVYSNAFTNAQQAFGADRQAQQWGTQATGNLYGLLKPNTTTGVTATAGNKNTTVATGSDPNVFGNLLTTTGNIFAAANPVQTSVPKP